MAGGSTSKSKEDEKKMIRNCQQTAGRGDFNLTVEESGRVLVVTGRKEKMKTVDSDGKKSLRKKKTNCQPISAEKTNLNIADVAPSQTGSSSNDEKTEKSNMKNLGARKTGRKVEGEPKLKKPRKNPIEEVEVEHRSKISAKKEGRRKIPGKVIKRSARAAQPKKKLTVVKTRKNPREKRSALGTRSSERILARKQGEKSRRGQVLNGSATRADAENHIAYKTPQKTINKSEEKQKEDQPKKPKAHEPVLWLRWWDRSDQDPSNVAELKMMIRWKLCGRSRDWYRGVGRSVAEVLASPRLKTRPQHTYVGLTDVDGSPAGPTLMVGHPEDRVLDLCANTRSSAERMLVQIAELREALRQAGCLPPGFGPIPVRSALIHNPDQTVVQG